MSTNGVNGANGPKTAADFKPEELQNAKQEKVKNTIFELNEAIAADVNQMCADNEIDNTEMDRIYDWVHVIDNMIGNMSAQVKQSCSEGLQILKDWVAELIDTSGMGKYNGQNVQYDGKTVTETSQTGQTAYEPTTTDNDIAQSSGNQVPKRMYWRADQADMQQVYETLTNPVGRRAGLYSKPQAQIGGIMGFIGQYANRLEKGQIAFLRQTIQNLNEITKQQREEELASVPSSYQAVLAGQAPLPDADKVKAYWNAVKTAGYSHNLKEELTVLGYSKKDAERISSQV